MIDGKLLMQKAKEARSFSASGVREFTSSVKHSSPYVRRRRATASAETGCIVKRGT